AGLDDRRRLPGPRGLADGEHRGLLGLGVEPVDEQHAVEVVDLVLHAPGEQVATLDGHRVAVHVLAVRDDVLLAAAVEGEAALREAWTAASADARRAASVRGARTSSRSLSPAGTGPSSSQPARAACTCASASGAPSTAAIRVAGGKPSAVRSASSRAAAPAG